MFRQIKQMKAMLEGGPVLAEQPRPRRQPPGGQARQLAMAGQAVQAWRAGGRPTGSARLGPNFEPIAGVSLEQYAAVVKRGAACGHDSSELARAAAARGISPVAWQIAVTGWNARLRGDAAVARRFNLRYQES